jgi:ethanolamine ammonia-lyase small subunit
MAEPPDIWAGARAATPARIGLRRIGGSIATAPLLDFRLAHASARDAVHAELDSRRLADDLTAIVTEPPLILESAAPDRQTYLLRPDLGRRLSDAARGRLVGGRFDLAIVIADGLSAGAAQAHAVPMLAILAPSLRTAGWNIAPFVIVRHGRVAVGDELASRLNATGVLVLIGECPGLSAPDSLGAYITWRPGPETTDANRNCISNIRPEGTPSTDAACRIALLLSRMRRLGYSGVAPKDEAEAGPVLGHP